jgi:hypothetical protein
MLEVILVILIVGVAAFLLGRSMHRAVSTKKPSCACGHAECPLTGQCTHETIERDAGRPSGCPLDPAAGDVLHQPPSR